MQIPEQTPFVIDQYKKQQPITPDNGEKYYRHGIRYPVHAKFFRRE
jgi:hypothetical protein